jgi:maleate isomerase
VDRRQFLGLASVAPAGSLIDGLGLAPAEAATPWRADGAGVARLGLLVPSFDSNPESEIWAMAPQGVAVFASRMDRGTQPFLTYVADPAHADAAVGLLTSLKQLRALLYAYSTTSYVMGLDGEEAFRARLAARLPGVPVVLAAGALAEALRALGAQRVALVHPPWFKENQIAMGKTYFAARGFEVVACTGIAPARDFTEVAAEEVHAWIARHTPPQAEAVVVAGNGLRAVGAIEAAEATLGRPVVTANQALLWQGLRLAAVTSRPDHYGRLFRL